VLPSSLDPPLPEPEDRVLPDEERLCRRRDDRAPPFLLDSDFLLRIEVELSESTPFLEEALASSLPVSEEEAGEALRCEVAVLCLSLSLSGSAAAVEAAAV